jgi:hypothetical protein
MLKSKKIFNELLISQHKESQNHYSNIEPIIKTNTHWVFHDLILMRMGNAPKI